MSSGMEKILGLSIGGHGAGTGTIFPANKHLVGAAAGCDLLILPLEIKRSQPAAAPTGVVTVRMFLLCSRND
jgi:hypothetical protein